MPDICLLTCLLLLSHRSGSHSCFLRAGALVQVKEGYFKGLVEAGRVTEAELGQHIFASKPASGGAVLTLKL